MVTNFNNFLQICFVEATKGVMGVDAGRACIVLADGAFEVRGALAAFECTTISANTLCIVQGMALFASRDFFTCLGFGFLLPDSLEHVRVGRGNVRLLVESIKFGGLIIDLFRILDCAFLLEDDVWFLPR